MKPLFPLFLLLVGVGYSTVAQAQDPGTAENLQVVVLRNGNVLHGEVYSLGDQYRVVTKVSEIRLWVREVERIAPTLTEAYEAKRLEVRPGSPEDHLRLAAWAIRQEMWPQAAREINDARTLAPQHPALPGFDVRLIMASRAAQRRDQPAPPEQSVAEVAERAGAAELAELTAMAGSLPAGTVEEFTRTIQPILVHNCSTAGCHHTSDSRSLRFNRDLLHGMANQRSTLRNLMATLQAIDRENIERSELLVVPASAHGGLSTPVFTGHRRQLHDRLVQWVYTATGQEPPTAAGEVAEDGPAPQELASNALVAADRYTANQASANLPLRAATDPQPIAEEGLRETEGTTESQEATAPPSDRFHFWQVDADGKPIESTQQRGARLKQLAPRDEFDPAIFNRLHQEPDGPYVDGPLPNAPRR